LQDYCVSSTTGTDETQLHIYHTCPVSIKAVPSVPSVPSRFRLTRSVGLSLVDCWFRFLFHDSLALCPSQTM